MQKIKRWLRAAAVKLRISKITYYELYYGFESDYSWSEVLRG